MWVAKKSSKRLLAPGTSSGGVRGGLDCKHKIASVEALRCGSVSSDLDIVSGKAKRREEGIQSLLSVT